MGIHTLARAHTYMLHNPSYVFSYSHLQKATNSVWSLPEEQHLTPPLTQNRDSKENSEIQRRDTSKLSPKWQECVLQPLKNTTVYISTNMGCTSEHFQQASNVQNYLYRLLIQNCVREKLDWSSRRDAAAINERWRLRELHTTTDCPPSSRSAFKRKTEIQNTSITYPNGWCVQETTSILDSTKQTYYTRTALP
jgi:hypothetical protein